jgi:hypothetical protein
LQSLWHSWWHSITWGYCNLVQWCLHWWKWRCICQPIPSAWLACVRITLDMLANTHTQKDVCVSMDLLWTVIDVVFLFSF